jgi:hypothetical protein
MLVLRNKLHNKMYKKIILLILSSLYISSCITYPDNSIYPERSSYVPAVAPGSTVIFESPVVYPYGYYPYHYYGHGPEYFHPLHRYRGW